MNTDTSLVHSRDYACNYIYVLQTLRVVKAADHVLLLSPALFLLSPALFVTPLFMLHFLLAEAIMLQKNLHGGEPPTCHQRPLLKRSPLYRPVLYLSAWWPRTIWINSFRLMYFMGAAGELCRKYLPTGEQAILRVVKEGVDCARFLYIVPTEPVLKYTSEP